jgi:hypothetical protein
MTYFEEKVKYFDGLRCAPYLVLTYSLVQRAATILNSQNKKIVALKP